MAELTISIVNNDNRELLMDCLQSVYENAGGLDIEVVVVDNASSDGSVAAVRGRFPEVRLIANCKKEGFSANHNKVLRTAASDFILVLNDDTVIHPGALETMVGFLRENPQAGAAGGFLLNADGTPQYTGKERPTLLAAAMISLGLHKLFPDNPVTSRYFRKKSSYAEVEEVDSVNAAAIMLRREALDKVGLFDEGFFLFCEDVDLSIRMREAGYRLYTLTNAKVTHYRGASTKSRRMVAVYHKSLLRFYRKHYAPKKSFIVNWLVYAGLALRFAVYYLYGRLR